MGRGGCKETNSLLDGWHGRWAGRGDLYQPAAALVISVTLQSPCITAGMVAWPKLLTQKAGAEFTPWIHIGILPSLAGSPMGLLHLGWSAISSLPHPGFWFLWWPSAPRLQEKENCQFICTLAHSFIILQTCAIPPHSSAVTYIWCGLGMGTLRTEQINQPGAHPEVHPSWTVVLRAKEIASSVI